MSNAVYYVSYKLKKNTITADFLLASEKLNDEHISKQKGYVSWKQLVDGETWADICTFETMDDLNNFLEVSKTPCEAALAFYSFINLPSCKSHYFSVERSYE
ncbi:MAG: hypothetical protein FWC09_02145 [Lachnospiraceae bacterium]|nr:hypothetical protein [Lachnospiraceae bacterium]